MPRAEAHGAHCYYEERGAGDPLLLIPGLGCTATVYSENTPALSERFRVIAFDPFGAGRSGTPASLSMQMLADGAAAVLDAAGVASAHVLGTSFGGMVAQHVAIEHPARVRRLVLGCTTPGGERHVLPPEENVDTFMAAAQVSDVGDAIRMRSRLNYSDAYFAAHADEIIARAGAADAMAQTPEGLAAQLEAVRAHDTCDALRGIAAPTLVAHGSDDGIVPVANGRILAGRIPNARLRVYDGARHVFFVERAAEFNGDVIDFLTAPDEAMTAK